MFPIRLPDRFPANYYLSPLNQAFPSSSRATFKEYLVFLLCLFLKSNSIILLFFSKFLWIFQRKNNTKSLAIKSIWRLICQTSLKSPQTAWVNHFI